MGCLERKDFANNLILVALKMSSISCLFVLLRKSVDILRSNNGEILRNLSLYIYKSLKMLNGTGKDN